MNEINLATEQMLKCDICTYEYDANEHKPCMLVPCGHTLCKKCLDSITNQRCPNDRQQIEKHMFNWEIIKLVSANDLARRIRDSLIVFAHKIDEMTRMRLKIDSYMETELAHLDSMLKKLPSLNKESKTSPKVLEYFESRLSMLKKQTDSARAEILTSERRTRPLLETLQDEFKSTKLEQPRLVEMNQELEKEMGVIDGVVVRLDEYSRRSRKAIDRIEAKLTSKVFVEKLQDSKTVESIERIEMDVMVGGGIDDEINGVLYHSDMGLIDLFETFTTKKKSKKDLRVILYNL